MMTGSGHAPTALPQKAGMKRTHGRKLLLNILLTSQRPLTHHEIAQSMKSVDRVTVYRMLNQFEQKGVVHKIDSRDRTWRFAVCSHGHKEHCHPHFSCNRCGKTECLSDVPLPRWQKFKKGYRVENQEVYIHGLCADCSKGRENGGK